ncbi:MAG TPA: acyltransferase [Candidatus Limnocylindrales bacterium]|jgi:acetyltransferase-like isoleucine patch superfamily enzyme|nr:acyltransferase [Candidatus Limnocylindrales bacterium]
MNARTLSAAPAGRWLDGALPPNVILGSNTILKGDHAFQRFRAKRGSALTIGTHCTMDGVHFAVGEAGRIEIGDYCYFCNVILLCEMELRIGNYVVAGWNTTLADTDFHPISPAARIQDAIACSPASQARARPAIPMRPVVIEDDVWMGPNVTILKGVRIGAGAFIEPGALITHDIPARARVLGNPAQVVGSV